MTYLVSFIILLFIIIVSLYKKKLHELKKKDQHLHTRHNIIHNDLKCYILPTTANHTYTSTSCGAVIIDFGKACDKSKGSVYKLSQQEIRHYKSHYPHIAPDLQDGKCAQLVSSDSSLGWKVRSVRFIKLFLRKSYQPNQ